MKALSFLLLLLVPVSAADYAVMLNDAERAALIDLINEAVKAKGLDAAGSAFYLANKIKSAGVVTERKEEPVPKEEKPQ
jgi:competence protein ComGC